MADAASLEALTRARTRLLIDGATGTELERRGVPMHDSAWCGLTALSHGDVLRDVHGDYVHAGARVITTDTFGSSRHVLEDSGVGDQFEAVHRAAARIAREAVDRAEPEQDVWVGGSICTSFMAGNEMTALDPQRARDNFRAQIDLLAEGGVDLLMLEMVLAHLSRVGLDISQEAVELAAESGLPVWVGISTKLAKDDETVLLFGSTDPYDLDPATSDVTQPLDERVIPVFEAGASVVGIMHTDIAACDPSVRRLAELWPGPIAAYPHSGHWENPTWNFDSVVDEQGFGDLAESWIDAGATVIGGCCGIGPSHIAHLRERFFG